MTDSNELQDRSLSAAEKWNKEAWMEHFCSDELLPFWVADMEFKEPPAVYEHLVKPVENGMCDYEHKRDSLTDAINPGYWFGMQGTGFARMTIACPRTMLKEGLSRLERAINGLEGNE